jgi:hypothetical protein
MSTTLVTVDLDWLCCESGIYEYLLLGGTGQDIREESSAPLHVATSHPRHSRSAWQCLYSPVGSIAPKSSINKITNLRGF